MNLTAQNICTMIWVQCQLLLLVFLCHIIIPDKIITIDLVYRNLISLSAMGLWGERRAWSWLVKKKVQERKIVSQRETGAPCLGNLVLKVGEPCPPRNRQRVGTPCPGSLDPKTGASLLQKMGLVGSSWCKATLFRGRFCRAGTRCRRNQATSEGAAINRFYRYWLYWFNVNFL